MHGRARHSLMAEGSGGSSDKPLNIPPLSFELPPDHIAARKKKRAFREYNRELHSQIREGTVKTNAETGRKNEVQLIPEIIKQEAPRFREYHRERHSQIKEGIVKKNAEPVRKNEVQLIPEITKQEALRYRGSEHAEIKNGAETEQRDSRLVGNFERKNERQEMSIEEEVRYVMSKQEAARFREYHRERHSQIKEGIVKTNAEPRRKNEVQLIPKITKQEAPRYRGSEHAEKKNGAETEQRDSRLVGKFERKNERQEMSIDDEVRYVLSKYNAILRRLEQEEEAEGNVISAQSKVRLYQTAVDKSKPLCKRLPKTYLGHVPGIHVGYEFQSRPLLNMLGMHRPLQAGIDFLGKEETNRGVSLATSILVAGGYEDNIDNGDVLIYTGHGGNDYEKSKKQIEDQKLTKANKALVNNYEHRQPVRVIRKCMPNEREGQSFRYDGLYTVEDWWKDRGRSGFLIFKFRLKRQEGQPPLCSNAVQFRRNSQRKNAVAVIKEDIAEGQEKFPIAVVNSVDNVHTVGEFNYIHTVKYPDWLGKPALPEGCHCVGGCTDEKECLCVRRNGGKFPYTQNGRLVRAKPVVYECGPSCRCPPSCQNKVTQHGLKHKLEVFRTPRNGWGVRSLEFVEAGDFITEYTGNLIADPTLYASANKMVFPIASISMEGNWGDLLGIVEDDDVTTLPSQIVENVGFSVDASRSGNASRFIGRNSRPNLCVQYVLYDHHDIRIPHVMFFASENISPQLELSINASVQQNTNKRFCSNARYTGKARPLGQYMKFT